jgi:hypothetical protein
MKTSPAEHSVERPTSGEGQLPDDACAALRALAKSATNRDNFYRGALRALARQFDAPYATVHIDTAAGTLEDYVCHGDSVDTRWKPLCDGLLLDTRYRELPVARLYQSHDLDQTFAVMAAPVAEDAAGVVGSVAVVVACADRTVAESQLGQLNALAALAGTLASSVNAAVVRSPRQPQDQTGIVKAGEHQTMYEFAFALVNGLKSKFGCEQVILGLVHGRRVKIVCISGLDDLYPRSPGVRLIQQAMEECLDAGQPVAYQHDVEASQQTCSTGHLLHKRWHLQAGNAAVASLPLRIDGTCRAVLSLRNRPNRPFERPELAKIEEMVAPLISGLLLAGRADRNLFRHGLDSARAEAAKWLGHGGWGRRVALAATMLLAAWLVLGTTQFIVTVPCQVVPEQVRQIAAPFQGTIRAANARAGDEVAAGQVLVQLDTCELELDRERLLAELQIARLDLSRALTAKDQAAAAQVAARTEVIHSQLGVVRFRIDRSTLRAPCAGVVLSGDVTRRVGEVVPLGAPLLQFAATGNWTLELHVPEFAAVYLETGQNGQFTTSARPDEAQACRLTRVEMAAAVVDGKNVFVAEADVDKNPLWIRVGMTGVARVRVGRRPVWWVGLHRTIDSLRLQWWKL